MLTVHFDRSGAARQGTRRGRTDAILQDVCAWIGPRDGTDQQRFRFREAEGVSPT